MSEGWPATIGVEGGSLATPPPGEGGVRAFRGVPFAAPPTGALRWRPPESPIAWDGVRSADRLGWNPLQPRLVPAIDPTVPGMSEDCLYLNVWTAAEAPDERRPVLVWIPGGAFLAGSAGLPRGDGAALARRGLVVVSMNYRLGAFGFLAHPALSAEGGGASGNYGLMDQVAALRWVQRSVAAFGGDPDRVTIGGHSAGASSANILMVSPQAEGLFHRVIGMGGSAMAATGGEDGSPHELAAAEAKGARFAATVGASDAGTLRALPADRLLAAAGGSIGAWNWNACVDGAVLPAAVDALLAEGRQADAPLLVGWAANEGATLAPESFGGDARPLAPQVRARFGGRAEALLVLYPHATIDEDRAAKAALAGDGFIGYPAWRWLTLHAGGRGAGRSFAYRFAYPPPVPEGWAASGATSGPPGAFHGAETPYALGNLAAMEGWRTTAKDQALSGRLAALWAAFVADGAPGTVDGRTWPAYAPDAPRLLHVGEDGALDVRADPTADRMAALGEVFAASPGALRYRGGEAGSAPDAQA